LSRAAFNLENNDIKAAVTELNQIKDSISVALLQDWKAKAENRLTAEQAANVLHAHAIIQHKKYGGL